MFYDDEMRHTDFSLTLHTDKVIVNLPFGRTETTE